MATEAEVIEATKQMTQAAERSKELRERAESLHAESIRAIRSAEEASQKYCEARNRLFELASALTPAPTTYEALAPATYEAFAKAHGQESPSEYEARCEKALADHWAGKLTADKLREILNLPTTPPTRGREFI